MLRWGPYVGLFFAGSVACGGGAGDSAVVPANTDSAVTGSNGDISTSSSSATASVTTTGFAATGSLATTNSIASTGNSTTSGSTSGTGGSSTATSGGQPSTTGSVGGGGQATAASTSASETNSTTGGTPTVTRPEGTIPNSPQPESTVGVPKDDWPDGLISPSLLEGDQINQPAVVNGYLLIGGNEKFWFYDVSNPASPQLLSEFSTPGATGGEAESHTLSFARYGDNYYLVTVGGRGIDTWDITDVNNPQHLDQVSIPGANYGDYTEAIWGVTWQGQYIYVGATNNGIKVVDAADPSSLELVKEVPTSQYGGVSAGPLDAVGNVLIVMTPKESGGVATLDISDPTNPTRLASFSTNISYIGQFYRRWVFLISPLRAWDVLTDPRNIGTGSTPIGQLNHGGAEYLSFQDDYLFLGHVRAEIGGTPGASKIDVSDPGSMRVESTVYGRQDRNNLNDDQFNIAFGNLLVLGDDQSPYAGFVIAAHQTEPDTTPPMVDTVIPKPDSSAVSTKVRIGVSFSDNIEIATVNANSFFVRPVGGQPLPGKYGLRMGVLNFDPDEDLQPGTTYEVVLPAGGVADFVGNTLAEEWVSTFTTN